jgi:hypothetical protein
MKVLPRWLLVHQQIAMKLQLQQKMPQPVYDDESSLFPPSNCETFLPRIFPSMPAAKKLGSARDLTSTGAFELLTSLEAN